MQRTREPARRAAVDALLRIEADVDEMLVAALASTAPKLRAPVASALADYFSASEVPLRDVGKRELDAAEIGALGAALRRPRSPLGDRSGTYLRTGDLEDSQEESAGDLLFRINAYTPEVLLAVLTSADPTLRTKLDWALGWLVRRSEDESERHGL